MVTEMKEMLNAACNHSPMSQASVYYWYNELKSDRKSAELMGRPGAPTTVLTEQIINTSATTVLKDYVTVCVLDGFYVYSCHNKKKC